MYINGSPKIRYEIIAETIKCDDNVLNLSYLCGIAGVSRSGFYYWLNNKNTRLASDKADQEDFRVIF